MRNKTAPILTLALLAACRGGNAAMSGAPPLAATTASKPIDKIQHVVIVIQENRSFNNLFYGFPGAKTVTSGMV